MSSDGSLLVVRHVPWEGPHRISVVLADVPQRCVDVLDGHPLPDPSTLAGAVVMGGPMSVNDTDRYPDLAREKAWIEQALFHELPLLGVCLGSQLIAHVLGASVTPAPAAEIGWGPVTVLAADDRLVGPLAPETSVLHWHGEQFELPTGATLLARSQQTPCQAFRHGCAWGLLFHLEADEPLITRWLAVASMADEARRVLGTNYADALCDGARAAESKLLGRSSTALDGFGQLVRARREGIAA